MTLDLKSLISKLDRNARAVVEQAATLCVSQTQFDVEPEHLLLALVKQRDPVVKALLDRYGIDIPALERQIEEAMGKLKRGNTRTPAFSPRVPEMLEAALLSAIGILNTPIISPALMLVAPLERDPLRTIVLEAAPHLAKFQVAEAIQLIPELTIKPGEAKAGATASSGSPAAASAPGSPPRAKDGSALGQYTIDLTAMARDGKLDPVTGRDSEIRQLIDVMMRRRQNNPILVGDPGVGKTAIVEGMAQRIADGDVPQPMKAMAVRTLDLGLLQAGAGVKGEFEERLKKLIAEVAAEPNPTVIFIDEAHTLIGAGGAAGQGDAANMLKPALARGEFRTIAATTWSEYKRHFEKDPALARRFQPIKVAEPTQDGACAMLRGLAASLEKHHRVRVLDDAVTASVSLSARYIPARQLPDKAISVLDTACARVAIARGTVPVAIADIDGKMQTLALEAGMLERQPGGGGEVRLAAIATQREILTTERAALAEKWQAEQAMITELDAALEADEHGKIPGLRDAIIAAQGEQPLIPWCVNAGVVADVVSEWTGIPVGAMSQDAATVVRNLGEKLGERIIGQTQAVTAIAESIQGHRAGLGDPGRPVGVFLLCGPSGVGKTETAAALAALLYGGDASLITVNMSEYQEAHSVATLRGSPPGYVGFGSGGVLTEAVRRRPYSVVLLDEAEKAHPDVLDLFYQVFDKGVLEDGEGIEVDFKNTLILLTCNLGEDELTAHAAKLRAGEPHEILEKAVELVSPVLRQRFRPAFLGRLAVVPYLPLDEAQVRAITGMRCDRVAGRFGGEDAKLVFTEAARNAIVRRALASDAGARVIDHILNGSVIPRLAGFVLDAAANGTPVGSVTVDADADGRLICRQEQG